MQTFSVLSTEYKQTSVFSLIRSWVLLWSLLLTWARKATSARPDWYLHDLEPSNPADPQQSFNLSWDRIFYPTLTTHWPPCLCHCRLAQETEQTLLTLAILTIIGMKLSDQCRPYLQIVPSWWCGQVWVCLVEMDLETYCLVDPMLNKLNY